MILKWTSNKRGWFAFICISIVTIGGFWWACEGSFLKVSTTLCEWDSYRNEHFVLGCRRNFKSIFLVVNFVVVSGVRFNVFPELWKAIIHRSWCLISCINYVRGSSFEVQYWSVRWTLSFWGEWLVNMTFRQQVVSGLSWKGLLSCYCSYSWRNRDMLVRDSPSEDHVCLKVLSLQKNPRNENFVACFLIFRNLGPY
jgi:hypothetical protein